MTFPVSETSKPKVIDIVARTPATQLECPSHAAQRRRAADWAGLSRASALTAALLSGGAHAAEVTADTSGCAAIADLARHRLRPAHADGGTGFVAEIHNEGKVLRVQFDTGITDCGFDELEELMLAYALTVHKSQDNEYRCVVIPVAWEHYIMLSKRLLYTAITRWRERVVLVGQQKALRVGVSRSRGVQRITHLGRRLVHALADPDSTGDGLMDRADDSTL